MADDYDLTNMLSQLNLDDDDNSGGETTSSLNMLGASEFLAGLAGPPRDPAVATATTTVVQPTATTTQQPQQQQQQQFFQHVLQQQPQQQQQPPMWGQPAPVQFTQHAQAQQMPPPPPPQQPSQAVGGNTVFMNGQYYQVPAGMQLAQVSNNGFELAPGQAGIPQQPHQIMQPQQPVVMQVGPNGQLQPAAQQQQQHFMQQHVRPPPPPQQAQAQVLTVPAGMSVDQFIAQLQAQGLTGQVLTGSPQAAQQPAPQQQQQQQQPPAPQYSPPAAVPQVSGQQAGPTPSWARGQQQQGGGGQGQGSRYATQQAQTPQQAARTSTTGDTAEDLTKLNPKAQPFVPKDDSAPTTGRTSPAPTASTIPPAHAPTSPSKAPLSPNGQQTAPSPAVPKGAVAKKVEASGATPMAIACPHCTDTGFLTEYVLRSHIKAKHSAELANMVGGGDGSAEAANSELAAVNPAVTALLEIVRQYLVYQCHSGSCSLEALTTFLDSTHAVAMGEASTTTTFSEILQIGGIRRFSYTADELHRAEVKPEIATAAENRVALPNVDYMANDTARSKEL